jgi:membrane protease subunit HflK
MSENDSNPLAPAAATPPPPADDAGTQALSDALRSSFFIVKIIMVGLVIVFLGSGFFTVGSQQKAIILRLGRPVGQGTNALLEPGFHFAFPRPIDEVVMIPFSGLQRVDSTIGWDQTPQERLKNAEPPPALPSLDPRSVSYALTADTNIVLVNGVLHFTVSDPIGFHFDFADSLVFVTNDLNNALLFACSQFTVDDILTVRRGAFQEAVGRRVQQLTDKQQLGITILQVDVQATPARYLAAKFQGVDKANVDREKARDQAITSANTKRYQALADAQSNINKAEAERARAVTNMAAEAKNFTLLRPDYERDPEMFKTVLLMPALEKVLAGAKDIMLEPHQNGRQIRLHVGSEPVAPPQQTNQVQ